MRAVAHTAHLYDIVLPCDMIVPMSGTAPRNVADSCIIDGIITCFDVHTKFRLHDRYTSLKIDKYRELDQYRDLLATATLD